MESQTVCLNLFGSVGVCLKIKHVLIFFTTVTDPLSPLPTYIPVSDFLSPPQTEIYTILCYLRLPGTLNARFLGLLMFSFSPRRSGLNPRFIPDPPCKRKTKIGHCCLRKSVISSRKSEEDSDQSETQQVCPRQDQC